ncbi:MAG: deoxynucleoside kinase [Clostridia bacterium]|nr:deoxynucleoside kinase [Clostridia bacterium]
MKKRLIAIDGLDASGKKTQTDLLAASLTRKGIANRCLDFPTYDPVYSAQVNLYLGGAFGDDPGAVNAYAASAFFAADRFCSYKLDWGKDLDAGKIIIANRYTSANAVHQLSKLPRSEWEGFLDWLNDYEYVKLGVPKPDAVVYLCLPPKLSEELLNKRCGETGAKKDIHEKSASHLENSYRAALYSAEKLGWIKIDCSKNGKIREIDDIQSELVERLRAALPDSGI